MACCGQNTPTGAGATTADTGKRVNYVQGMLLGVDDFVQEQAWGIARRHELAREVLGYGTVRGLQVSIDPDVTPPTVRVTPGMAWTPSGAPVCVAAEQCCDINAWLLKNKDQVLPRLVGDPAPLTVHVVLSYAELPCDKMPIPGEPCRSEDALMADSRIADCFRLELRLDAPDQIEEDAIRDFADWLAKVPVERTSPPLSEKAFMDQLSAAAHAWLEPSSPHPGDYMFGSPPADLGTTDELMRAALRLWVTELRPLWRARYGCGPDPLLPGGTNDAVLLASLALTVYPGTMEAKTDVAVLEDARPILLSLRMVQELIAQNPAPEPATYVVPARSFDLPDTVGTDTAYARADHNHGTPKLPDLDRDVIGPIADNTVVALRRRPIADTAPQVDDVLAYSDAGQWTPQHLPQASNDLPSSVAFDSSGSAGESSDYSRADHVHEVAKLAGDTEGPISSVTVTGLQRIPVSDATPAPGNVLVYVPPDGSAGPGEWEPQALALPSPGTTEPTTVDPALPADIGLSPNYARADHRHDLANLPPVPKKPDAAPPALAFGKPGAVGDPSAYASADHSHAIPDAVGRRPDPFEIVSAGKVVFGVVFAPPTNPTTKPPAAAGPITHLNPKLPPGLPAGLVGNVTVPYCYGPVKAEIANTVESQVEIVISVVNLKDAKSPLKAFVVKLTTLWNQEIPTLTFLAGDPVVAGADVVQFRVVIFASQAFAAGNYGFEFELSRFVPAG